MSQPIEHAEIDNEQSLISAIEMLIEISRQFNAGYASLSFSTSDGMTVMISISENVEE